MPTPTRPAINPPTLRDLSLDAIHALAMKLRAQDPSLTQAQAVTKAASSHEGREAYAFYVHPWSSLPWPQAVAKMDAATKAGAPRRKAPAAAATATPGPADHRSLAMKLARKDDVGTSGPPASQPALRGPAASQPPKPAPATSTPAGIADHLYAAIKERALAARTDPGQSASGAIADFLATGPGAELWRQFNAARRAEVAL